MLPSGSTNRYGDMLKEFYKGVKDGTLSETRLDDIQRVFNELWDREIVYQSWVTQRKIANAALDGFPFMKTVQYQRLEVQTIANNTETDVFFDDSTADQITILDSEKLRLTTKGRNSFIGIGGTIQWEANSTGWRGLTVKVYDSSDVQLFGQTLHALLPISGDPTTVPFFDVVFTAQENQADYIKFTVIQTSGGDLDIESMRLSVFEMNF
jgi:hypothetical protein